MTQSGFRALSIALCTSEVHTSHWCALLHLNVIVFSRLGPAVLALPPPVTCAASLYDSLNFVYSNFTILASPARLTHLW